MHNTINSINTLISHVSSKNWKLKVIDSWETNMITRVTVGDYCYDGVDWDIPLDKIDEMAYMIQHAGGARLTLEDILEAIDSVAPCPGGLKIALSHR